MLVPWIPVCQPSFVLPPLFDSDMAELLKIQGASHAVPIFSNLRLTPCSTLLCFATRVIRLIFIIRLYSNNIFTKTIQRWMAKSRL
ncbi:hypothetical protein EJJ36_11050 [Acinetobacter junii]|nr:hypothetical protein EJJ36_11050 [Acinetobacter junii]